MVFPAAPHPVNCWQPSVSYAREMIAKPFRTLRAIRSQSVFAPGNVLDYESVMTSSTDLESSLLTLFPEDQQASGACEAFDEIIGGAEQCGNSSYCCAQAPCCR
jgi:hypothetical protein